MCVRAAYRFILYTFKAGWESIRFLPCDVNWQQTNIWWQQCAILVFFLISPSISRIEFSLSNVNHIMHINLTYFLNSLSSPAPCIHVHHFIFSFCSPTNEKWIVGKWYWHYSSIALGENKLLLPHHLFIHRFVSWLLAASYQLRSTWSARLCAFFWIHVQYCNDACDYTNVWIKCYAK